MYKAIHSYPFYRLMATMYQANDHTNKNLILEPLSCVLRIILLHYKEKGTKISIVDNGISYNSPSVVQGFFGSWYGDKREDLHNLCSPLIYFTKWYPKENDFFKGLYKECEKGFIVLKDVYDKHSTIHHTINHYLSILKGETSEDIPESVLQETPENPVIGHLQHIWSADEITLVFHFLSLIKDQSEGSDVYIRNLEDILDSKDRYVHEYIIEIVSGY